MNTMGSNKYGYATNRSMPSYQIDVSHRHLGSIYKASMMTATKTNKYGYAIQRSMPSYQMDISHEHYGIHIQSFHGDSDEDKQIWMRNSKVDAILLD